MIASTQILVEAHLSVRVFRFALRGVYAECSQVNRRARSWSRYVWAPSAARRKRMLSDVASGSSVEPFLSHAALLGLRGVYSRVIRCEDV